MAPRSDDDDGQYDLFGGQPPSDVQLAPHAVGPADPDEDVQRLSAALPAGVHLGTSSWTFPGWAGIVYDRVAEQHVLVHEGLAAYARHPLLGCVGIDRTFYEPLAARVFAEYASVVPEDFRFVVKAHALCSSPWKFDAHGRRGDANPLFLDPVHATRHVISPMLDGLGGRTGVLVFQFPPLDASHTREPRRFAERLAGFLAALPAGAVYAVELRDRVLLNETHFSVLADSGARHCFNVHPRMPPLVEQWRECPAGLASPLLVRWMLHGRFGYEQARRRHYPFNRLVDEDLTTRVAVARMCLDAAARGVEAFVIANNKAEGSAPLSLVALARTMVDELPRRLRD